MTLPSIAGGLEGELFGCIYCYYNCFNVGATTETRQ